MRYRSLFCIADFYHVAIMSLKASWEDETVIDVEVNVTEHQNNFGIMVLFISSLFYFRENYATVIEIILFAMSI